MKLSNLLLLMSASSPLALAGGDGAISKPDTNIQELSGVAAPEWGVLMGGRYTSIPFSGSSSSTDVFPLFYYEGERFFLRGDYGGVKLWESGEWGVNAIARHRFYDIPEEFNSDVEGSGADMGLQAFWQYSDTSKLEFEVLSDPHSNLQGNARIAADFYRGDWRVFPEFELRVVDSGYSTRYYGLERVDVDGGVEARARLKARRRVWKDLFFEGGIEAGWIGNTAGKSPLVDDDFEWGGYVGLGLFQETKDTKVSTLNAKPYWRISQGWGTDSALLAIPFGQFETQKGADVRMTSIFYGHPLSDTLFGAPWEVYLTPGFVYHWSSDVQDTSTEFVLAFKAYHTFDLPWRLRVGFAEGISYADSPTFYESKDLSAKQLSPNKLLNYLDVSLDLNMGDVLKKDSLNDLWLGTAIHHRSSIFGSSSAFGEKAIGVNFLTVYLQWHGDF